MAYASLSRRALASLMITTMLVSCSAEGLVPPAGIDSDTRVSAISPISQPAPIQQPYQTSPSPVSQVGSGGYSQSYPGAAPGQPTPAAPQSVQSAALPMIDSPEAMQLQGQPQNVLRVPEEGVNMDAQFGFAQPSTGEGVTGLAQEQDQMIAEGGTAQPVVAGIGTDAPMAIGGAPSVSVAQNEQMITIPPKRQAEGLQGSVQNQSLVWGDQSPVVAPTRLPEEPQQVAMLAPNNPAAEREPIRPREVMPASEVSCRAELRRLGVEFRDIQRIADGPSCGIDYPVLLSGFSGNIDLKPATKLNCPTTLALAKWVKYELAPSSRYRYLSGVKTIESMGGYSCRRMNNSRQKRNPMSEHARGNAIDLGKFVLKNGKRIDVRKKGFFAFRERGLLNTVRDDSCKYFHTVLGPGSNKEHWNHFHFDLRARKSGSKYCD
ncbi:hypothetical protein ABID21_001002 [Pseudorhizobium tarimense]|uniref:Extensin-like C-terminal domain-containing protein n=1 Tax=Pseudorhizobium tarimense TaxID=1079109 RepID=A0ABV2H2Y4_9HYPH|nr:extensin family protein [Pseudorhizobium tarimense]MCJ8518104.1 extensin family protein [Pseudorhizobium tarimense]